MNDWLDKQDREYRHLKAGQSYRVARAFRDYDGQCHEEGETFEFLGANFVPYHDGLSLFVKREGHEEQIRLQLHPEEQQDIVEQLGAYLRPVS